MPSGIRFMIRSNLFRRFPRLHVDQRVLMILCGAAIPSMTACVKQSTYEAVQMEIAENRRALISTKDELSQMTAQAARLQEVKQEQEHNVVELLEALQKEKDAEALWQKQVREKTDALVARLNALQSQQRWMTRETDRIVKEQKTLEALVAKYKDQLQDSVPSPEPAVSPPPQDMAPTSVQPTAISPPTPAPPPAASPAPPAPQPPPQPAPTPTRQNPEPEPLDDSWFSTVKEWLGSLWRMIFS